MPLILTVHVPDLKTYRENPHQVLDRPYTCPGCGHLPLARHGARLRWIYTATEKFQTTVFRLQCKICGSTFTLLPDCLLAGFRYAAGLIQDAIAAYLTSEASYRTLAVRIAGGVMQELDSVTDALLSIRLRPSYQRIQAWVSRFAGQAVPLTQELTTWLLRLRPDSQLLHLLASPVPTFEAKSTSELKRLALRAAALLHALIHRIPELSEPWQGAWLAGLNTLRRRIQDASPRSGAGPPCS